MSVSTVSITETGAIVIVRAIQLVEAQGLTTVREKAPFDGSETNPPVKVAFSWIG